MGLLRDKDGKRSPSGIYNILRVTVTLVLHCCVHRGKILAFRVTTRYIASWPNKMCNAANRANPSKYHFKMYSLRIARSKVGLQFVCLRI